MRINSNSITHY
jgi:hypothetical protein